MQQTNFEVFFMDGLANVDGFKLFIQVYVWLGSPPLIMSFLKSSSDHQLRVRFSVWNGMIISELIWFSLDQYDVAHAHIWSNPLSVNRLWQLRSTQDGEGGYD